MKLAYDLHIHSALSPCAEDDMTPNNIVNMSLIKGLDIIAVTDHNSAKNVKAVMQAAKGKDIVIVPGIEVNTKEDIHVLCYFDSLENALMFDDWLYDRLVVIPFDKNKFGNQLIMNENDEVIGIEEKFLHQGAYAGLDEIIKAADLMGGIAVPAHINREANSLLNILGFIPKNKLITAVELSRFLKMPDSDLTNYHMLYSSDAHSLGLILERESFIDIEGKNIKSFIKYLKSEKNKKSI